MGQSIPNAAAKATTMGSKPRFQIRGAGRPAHAEAAQQLPGRPQPVADPRANRPADGHGQDAVAEPRRHGPPVQHARKPGVPDALKRLALVGEDDRRGIMALVGGAELVSPVAEELLPEGPGGVRRARPKGEMTLRRPDVPLG